MAVEDSAGAGAALEEAAPQDLGNPPLYSKPQRIIGRRRAYCSIGWSVLPDLAARGASQPPNREGENMSDIDRIPGEGAITLYTDRDLERARNRGKLVGWLQGGVAVVAGGILLQLLGWIPTALVLGLVGYGLYRLLSGGKKGPDA